MVNAVPAAIGRTFTIRQFARLCDAVPPLAGIATGIDAPGIDRRLDGRIDADAGEAGRRLVAEAKLARSSLQPVPGAQEDLPDPIGGSLADFRLCADRLQEAIEKILRPLT